MIRLLLSLPFFCLSLASQAELIPVSQDVIDRFDIGFAAVTTSTEGAGATVPGVVIRSPDAVSRVIPRYDGVVSAWHVAPGDTVAAGQPVVTLSSPMMLDELARWVSAREANIRARAMLERDQTLFDAGIIAQSRLTDSESLHRESAQRLAAVTQRLEAAGLDHSNLDGSDQGSWGAYTLVAPTTGRLARQARLVGETVAMGETLASINRPEPLWVRAEVPRRFESRLSAQQPLHLRSTGEALTLKRLDGEFDTGSQTIGLLAQFDDASNLRPGAIVSLALPDAGAGIHIPASAVVHTGRATVVYVRTSAGVEARELALSPNGTDYIASEGISPGEQIVIQGTAVIKGIQLGLGGGDA